MNNFVFDTILCALTSFFLNLFSSSEKFYLINEVLLKKISIFGKEFI